MNGKRYNRYVDDFINSHRYINCNNAVCRNCHEMNIHIVKGLLNECAHLVQSLFAASDFSFEKCMELRRLYDRSEPLPPPIAHSTDCFIKAPPLSFDCNFTQEQMTGIVSCANTYHLFCVSEVCIKDMEALFSCKEGFHIRVNNLRHVVILFDALLENSFIQSRWQSVLDKGAVPAIQRWCTVHHRFQSFIGTFRCQKQQDIGRLWNKKSHQGIGIIKR